MAKSYKKRLEDALWDLLDEAHRLGVVVSFHDPRTTYVDGAFGEFRVPENRVRIFKEIDEPLTSRHIHTLAHELRHVFQFRNRMWRSYWLGQLNVKYSTNAKHLEALEQDADEAANEFLIKRKIPLPGGEGK